MSQIGQLVPGAGVNTNIVGQAQLDSYLLIGDVDTANPLQGLTVEVDGVVFMNIQSAALITAFAKWQMETAGAGVVGLMLKIATGKVPLKTNLRLQNAGATVPLIYANSDAGNGVPMLGATVTINATSYQDFKKFSALFLQTPASVSSVEITYSDGHRDTLAIQEVDALFALRYQSEADGRLGGVSVIDNSNQSIVNVRVNTNATALTVLVVKIPDQAFEAVKAMASQFNQ